MIYFANRTQSIYENQLFTKLHSPNVDNPVNIFSLLGALVTAVLLLGYFPDYCVFYEFTNTFIKDRSSSVCIMKNHFIPE
ncbi:hypothetical protein GDO78_009967 [Eleutherodactylus coqui]|uniref:Uncharacterized protein n=1 Tax=Eleutherodactylus coqui TaxID=57060 RepID=A0A8J6FA28_ELECQ|nr:hypothetical protein GDO78_009967 [Eleutherodactylus coqui]